MGTAEAADITHKATAIDTGYHPDGYRIDKTTGPLNRYTRWDITRDDNWINPKPVCFHSLPEDGWIVSDGFDWKDE